MAADPCVMCGQQERELVPMFGCTTCESFYCVANCYCVFFFGKRWIDQLRDRSAAEWGTVELSPQYSQSLDRLLQQCLCFSMIYYPDDFKSLLGIISSYNGTLFNIKHILSMMFASFCDIPPQVAAPEVNELVMNLYRCDDRVDARVAESLPLLFVTKRNNSELVKVLIHDGRVDPGSRNERCLTEVAKHGNVELFQLLIQTGKVGSSIGLVNALDVAAQHARLNVVKLLVETYNIIPRDSTLESASKSCDLQTILYMFDKSNSPSSFLKLIMAHASSQRAFDILSYFKDHELISGTTCIDAVCRASAAGHVDILRMLVPCCSNETINSAQAGLYAVLENQVDALNFWLTESSWDPSSNGSIALLKSVELEHDECTSMILRDQRIILGRVLHPILEVTIPKSRVATLDILKQHPDIAKCRVSNGTMSEMAAKSSTEFARVLLDGSFLIETYLRSAVEMAARRGKVDMVRLLAPRGNKMICFRNVLRTYPECVAAYLECREILEMVHNQSKRDLVGCLAIAAQQPGIEMIKVLMEVRTPWVVQPKVGVGIRARLKQVSGTIGNMTGVALEKAGITILRAPSIFEPDYRGGIFTSEYNTVLESAVGHYPSIEKIELLLAMPGIAKRKQNLAFNIAIKKTELDIVKLLLHFNRPRGVAFGELVQTTLTGPRLNLAWRHFEFLSTACRVGNLEMLDTLLNDEGMLQVMKIKGKQESLKECDPKTKVIGAKLRLEHFNVIQVALRSPKRLELIQRLLDSPAGSEMFNLGRFGNQLIRKTACRVFLNTIRQRGLQRTFARIKSQLPSYETFANLYGVEERIDMLCCTSENRTKLLSEDETPNLETRAIQTLLQFDSVRYSPCGELGIPLAYQIRWFPVLKFLIPMELETCMLGVFCLEENMRTNNIHIGMDMMRILISNWCSLFAPCDN